ncbi:MAG: RHS repeat-associated core domain-containing protein, partial [Bacteroidaceae bacterium]|nr:RHS repeat-associated core domain-containing protein [Bacteroidaceae bacterium]
QFTYDPYGNVLEQAGAAADFLRFRFSTKYTDSEVGIVSYLMRFYKPSNGRWLNRDPIEEYGGENLYAFCQNNPTSYYDVNGCWAFIDNVVAFVTGAVIGAGLQAVSDVVRGEVSGWETYVGAAVAGGVVAEVLLHVPTAVGMSKAIYGGAAAAAGNLVKQTCEVFVSKKSDNYDWRNFSVDTVAGASLAMIPFPKIPHVTAGRGSYLSVARRINTQYANGTISHVSAMTTVKSAVGVATEYGIAYNIAQPMLLDVEQKVESVLTVYYYEAISIRLVDKCGNVVEVTYQGEFNTNEQ